DRARCSRRRDRRQMPARSVLPGTAKQLQRQIGIVKAASSPITFRIRNSFTVARQVLSARPFPRISWIAEEFPPAQLAVAQISSTAPINRRQERRPFLAVGCHQSADWLHVGGIRPDFTQNRP